MGKITLSGTVYLAFCPLNPASNLLRENPMTTPPSTPEPNKNKFSQDVTDRRIGLDRRDIEIAKASNLERRRGPGRRLTDFVKTAEEGEMNKEQFLFLLAIDTFKRVNHKSFPTWTDVLEIIRKLGYRKTLKSEIALGSRAVDWTEHADAAIGVNKLAHDQKD